MDISGWAAFFAVPAAAVAALYPWLRDRGDLTQIERITKVLDEAGDDMASIERAALRTIRQRHIERFAIASAVPRGAAFLGLVIFGFAWGVLVGLVETYILFTAEHNTVLGVMSVYVVAAVSTGFSTYGWFLHKQDREEGIRLVRRALRDPDSFETTGE